MTFKKLSSEKSINDGERSHFVAPHGQQDIFLEMSDGEIWKKFREDDESAFVHIYENYFSQLFNYGHRFCQNRESVKDHIQDMFVDMRKNKSRLGDTTSIKFYLFSSLRRRIIRAESKNLFFANNSVNLDNYDFEVVISPEQNFINNQMNARVKDILSKNLNLLSSRQKEAIMYYYYEGFSYVQVSKLMGFSKVKYARILVYRAVKKMKENINVSEIIGLFIGSLFI
ncbi:RNA polymerase sigma factor [Reichenbachiella sp. MALMAid0571]|uniref:RNA polymerase sigma factor n=1 Tax=Reichenbachiella sp. MALMAid0571 TaxID=3143939 RepID=UPI0032DF0B68